MAARQPALYYVGPTSLPNFAPNVNTPQVNAVSAATFYTAAIPRDFNQVTAYLVFYDASGNVVTPTAGTAVFEASPDGTAQWLVSSNSASITVTNVKLGSATYTPPVFSGLVLRGRVTLAGVTGATSFAAWFHCV